MILKLYFFASLFLYTSLSYGKKPNLDFDLGINLQYESFTELENRSSYEAEIYGRYKHKFNKHLGIILAPHLDLNKFENSKERSYLVRTENSGLYVNYEGVSLTTGFLSHSFGLSQLFSPLNFVDTASYWSPLNPQKISSGTIRLMYTNKHLRIFGSYMPKRFENIYPGNKTPWIPTKIPGSIESEGDTFFFPETANYIISDKEELDEALSHNYVAGLRLKTDPIFAQVLYYRGIDTDPTVNLDLNLTAVDLTPGQRKFQIENPIGVIPVYQTVERYGLSLRYTLPFKWRLLYEGNMSKGDENSRQGYRESQTHTAGLEWGIPIGRTLLLGVIQAYTSKNSNESSLGLVSPFREAYLFGANWKYQKINLSGGYFTSKSLQVDLYSLKTGYDVSKNLSFYISGNFLDGDLAELLSGILSLDTVALQIQYKI